MTAHHSAIDRIKSQVQICCAHLFKICLYVVGHFSWFFDWWVYYWVCFFYLDYFDGPVLFTVWRLSDYQFWWGWRLLIWALFCAFLLLIGEVKRISNEVLFKHLFAITQGKVPVVPVLLWLNVQLNCFNLTIEFDVELHAIMNCFSDWLLLTSLYLFHFSQTECVLKFAFVAALEFSIFEV